MSPAERALYQKLRARAAQMQGDLAQRLLAAYDVIRQSLTEAELARAISQGHVDQLITELLSDEATDPAFLSLRRKVDQAVLEATRQASQDLPPRFRVSEFNMLSQEVRDAALQLDSRVIQGIRDDLRQTVKQHVLAGLEAGENPRTIARGLRDVLPLAPNQEQAVRNFRSLVESGDPAALTRALRDRRFDGTLRKGTPTPAQIERMTEAYRKGMVAFNAETHARTAALDAHKLGQKLGWVDAIERGVVDRAQLQRTWVTVGDSRVRPEHVRMNGQTVGFDSPFSNGDMTPGENEYNCRCIVRVTLRREALAA